MQKTPRIREFPDLAGPDFADAVVHQMHRTLDDFVAHNIPDNEYSFDDLVYFINSLVKRQNGPGQFITWGGNWSLIPTDESAPSDVRVALIFFPSYLAVSFLSLFLKRYKEQADKIPDFIKAFHQGIHFITARRLFGHGLDGNFERIEAIRILIKGQVPAYLLENRANSEECKSLYEIMVQFKTDLLSECNPCFESLELIRKLEDFPDMTHFENPYYSWSIGQRHRGVILEAPYTISPGNEYATGEIAEDVAARTGCSYVVSKISKNTARYTGKLDQHNRNAIIAYNAILRKIVNTDAENSQRREDCGQFLHLILRGMNDSYGSDVELSSRYGQACEKPIIDNIMSHLHWGLQGYSRRIYTITSDALFNGGSKYLDYFRNGNPHKAELVGFGPRYNALEIRTSKTVRSTALGRIKDLLVEIIETKVSDFE